MRGWIRTFKPDRGFGFIKGDDGQEYFFHLDDVDGGRAPDTGQAVTFHPTSGAKGLRARSVVVSSGPPRAQKIYTDPDRFIMTREPEVRGYVIVRVIGDGFWAESNDPNQARDILRHHAQGAGANAVVYLDLQKYSKRQACSNYQYTMHRFHGRAVIVKRVGHSTDPGLIARSNAEMRRIQDGGAGLHSLGSRVLVRPLWWRFLPVHAWSMLRVAAAVAWRLGMLARHRDHLAGHV